MERGQTAANLKSGTGKPRTGLPRPDPIEKRNLANLLIILGAAAALGGLAWLAYVGSVMKGSRTNALVGGISSLVVGGAVIVLGASISDEPEQVQQFISDGAGFATPIPEAEPTPTPEIDPEEEYRQLANDLAIRAGSDLSRVIQLLRSPNSDSPIWVNDIRQTSSQFARYSVRANELVAPAGRADIQEQLVSVLADLALAGRQVNDSLDAIGFQNVFAAEEALRDALGTLTGSSPILADVVNQTADESG